MRGEDTQRIDEMWTVGEKSAGRQIESESAN